MSRTMLRTALMVGSALLLSMTAYAQDASTELPWLSQPAPGSAAVPGALPQVPKPAAVPAEPTTIGGYRIGTMRLIPFGTVTQQYDDNIYATPGSRVGDWTTVLAPGLRLESNWARSRLNLYGSVEGGVHASKTRENYLDATLGGDGRYDLGANTKLYGGAEYGRLHESRESPDAVNGTEPTIYTDANAFGGVLQQIGAASLRLGGTVHQLTYHNTPSTAGTINNHDRNRNVYELGTRLGYALLPGIEGFVQGTLDLRNYADTFDDNGYKRDSNGYRAAVGGRTTLLPGTRAEAYVGTMSQNYDDSRFGTTDAPYFGATLSSQVTAATAVNARVDRQIAETTLAGSSGSVDTIYSLGISHDLSPKVVLNGRMSYTAADYKQVSRADDTTDFTLGARYYLTPIIYLGGGWTHSRRASTDTAYEYTDNVIYAQLGADLGGRAPKEPALKRSSDPFSGFYVGVEGGPQFFATHHDGPRSGNQWLNADYGTQALSGGPFFGLGETIGHTYVGAEFQTARSTSDWDYITVDAPGRADSVRQREDLAGSLRLGYVLRNAALFYGRLGYARSGYNTAIRLGDNRYFNFDSTVGGARYGMGAEVALTTSTTLRLEYVRSTYGEFTQNTAGPGPGAPDSIQTYKPSDDTVRIGVAWHFGKTASDRKPEFEPAAFSGAYAGLQVGPEALTTALEGQRNLTTPPITGLQADYAEHGVTGGPFAGYGRTFGRLYLGGELEGSDSTTEWRMSNDPNGREEAVHKRFDAAAALRAGYVVGDGVMVYAKAGPAVARFDTRLRTDSGGYFSTDAWRPGMRVGLGTEVLLSRSLFLRAEYVDTRFEGYELPWNEAGTSTSDHFSNWAGAFRLGLGYRF